MKKLLFLGVGSALMFTMAGVGPAQADTLGDTHRSTSILEGAGPQSVAPGGSRCASCHRAHTAKAEMLLQDTQPAVCYSCHGGAGTFLDVVDGIDPTSAATDNALRGGGFAYAKIDGGAGAKLTVTAPTTVGGRQGKAGTITPLATGTAVTSRHQIDGATSGTMWGNGAISSTATVGKGVTLECGSCHDPHGNGNYRLLKPLPNESGATVAVNIPDATGERVYTTENYWLVTDRSVPLVTGGALPITGTGTSENLDTTVDKTDSWDGNQILVGKGGTDGYITNVAAWCTTCHTRYLAGSGSYKTDSKDAVFTYRHRSDSTDKEGVGRPNCIQCHVSHGTNVAMTGTAAAVKAPDGALPTAKGLAGAGSFPKTGADVVATGTSRLLRVDNRGTCQMCHNK